MKTVMIAALGIGILAHASAQADGGAKLLNCQSSGGGYLTQGLQVDTVDQQTLVATLTRFSPIAPEEKSLQLNIEGQNAVRASIAYPLKSCIIRPADSEHGVIFSCTTGISRLQATLTDKDGNVR